MLAIDDDKVIECQLNCTEMKISMTGMIIMSLRLSLDIFSYLILYAVPLY